MVAVQKDIFLGAEADAWFERNKAAMEGEKLQSDPVLRAVQVCELAPAHVLEIGCSTGWRLQMLAERYGCQGTGVDPSDKAVAFGKQKFTGLDLSVGTADVLPYADGTFDLVIFGFCLYLCDRKDLFTIAAQADRVLADNGHLAILDFYPPYPYRNTYVHTENVYSYKMDYASMFTWNPSYTQRYVHLTSHGGTGDISNPDDRIGVSVLKKMAKWPFLCVTFISPVFSRFNVNEDEIVIAIDEWVSFGVYMC